VSRLAGLALFVAISGCSSNRLIWFRNEDARNRSIANYRDPAMRVEVGRGSGYERATPRAPATNRYGDARNYVVVDAGNENPILTVSRCAIVENPRIPYGNCRTPSGSSGRRWSLQTTLPITFHLLWDPFTDNQPIVDTDYEFGLEESLRFSVNDDTELRTGVYIGHESTHIGDEYTIKARSQGPFPRINVSYFPLRYNLGARHYFDPPRNSHRTRSWVQLYGEVQWPEFFKGSALGQYYQTDPSELNGVAVPLTTGRLESFVALDGSYFLPGEYKDADASDRRVPAAIVGGVWVGRRKVFPYLESAGQSDMAPAVNVVLGYAFPSGLTRAARTELYLRGYTGPNPYGQLRSQRSFSLLTFGARVTP
jgi:hypothetical protein